MSSPLLSALPMVFVLIGVVLYAVLAGADFGAGCWTLLSGPGAHGAEVRDSAHHSMGPVWEANHVWLIFVLTVFWSAYPTAFGSIASTLAVPMFIAGLGIVLRGAAYVLRSGASGSREHVLIDGIFALSSIITPFALGTMVGAIATGGVPVGNAAGAHFSSWLGATQILDGVIAVVTSAYLAAVYLAADCARRGEPQLARDFRLRALAAGPLAGGLAVAGLVALHHSAHPLYHELLDGRALPAVLVSAAAGITAIGLVYRRRFEPARYVAALALAAVLAGWALAQWPHVLPGLDLRQAAASHDTLVAVIVAVLGGAAIVFPSLAWLFRLSLRGGFDPVAATKQVPSGAPAPRSTSDHSTGAGRVAVAALIVGLGLLVFADARPLHAVGVAALITFVISGFMWLAPALLP
ncbi:MAG TPA: cytochrome d ubiquinol oxidase subunit II [Solirubrobacteraceae bacterium]|nr:cytochrome d ubiquinol oxidase subunit II [Solirubrobacteraceae bacterium]